MDLKLAVESAEYQLKQILERFFITHYDENSLPSHGIDHHRRVWRNARDLFLCLAEDNRVDDLSLPLKLIVASYLHDIGMSVDRGVKHGRHSRELCNRFLIENNLGFTEFEKVLDAIENHDNKEYKTIARNHDLLTILSVADDMDAFGFSGIFRYAEIYLARGIEIRNLGNLIKENAAVRFENFINTFGFLQELVLKQRIRYKTLEDFYDKYNSLSPSYEFSFQKPYGYCGVIEIFVMMLNEKKSLNDTIEENRFHPTDPVISWFFNGLAGELFSDLTPLNTKK
jgi:HD superfamily phosphodiesterase